MDPTFLERTAIPHIRQQLRRADLVLFTGAGFSRSTTNLDGTPLPDGRGLARLLWSMAYPDRDFDKRSSLQDIYEASLRRKPKELERVLRTALTVAPDSIDDWIVLYYKQPWHKAYTLNVDSLADALNQKPELPRSLTSVSGTSGSRSLEAPPDQVLKVIHLNGTLADLPSNVTFSHTQYAQRLAVPDQIYQEFSAEFLGRPFIFVGTNIDESPLWQSIEQRRLKGPRGMRERRPRSYLVTPDLDLAKRERLEAFNVWWLPMKAERFAQEVLEPLRQASVEGHGFLAAAASAGRNRLQEVGELIAEPTARSEFLLGAQPLWSDLQSDRAITRLCDAHFLEEAEERIKCSGPRGVLAITGTAGTGKTTSLMALALRLLAKGHQVAWVDDTTDVDARTIVRGMSEANAPRIIAIDGAEEKLGGRFSYLARDLVQLRSNPLILASVRSGRADAVLNPYVLRGIRCAERVVPPLADTEIDDLIDVLAREKRLGVLRGASRTEQRMAFQRQAERQLLVAMIQAARV